MDYNYDQESDVLSVTIAKKPFDYAREMGDFVVHFDKTGKPVYLEILNAKSFLQKVGSLPNVKNVISSIPS